MELLCWVAGLMVGSSGGMFFSALIVRNNWRADTVKRGLALYDPQTGKWRWRERGE